MKIPVSQRFLTNSKSLESPFYHIRTHTLDFLCFHRCIGPNALTCCNVNGWLALCQQEISSFQTKISPKWNHISCLGVVWIGSELFLIGAGYLCGLIPQNVADTIRMKRNSRMKHMKGYLCKQPLLHHVRRDEKQTANVHSVLRRREKPIGKKNTTQFFCLCERQHLSASGSLLCQHM